ncbi:hypothetical protein [Noviherbaspirillum suwonense]|uniref:hypothetical protein n=1 Tax=Noviherbaspirillum suwonense TaxID=1224511 RepID=UPI0024B78C75|nr:hypothetical protein [Noviherbaspirillum suwonense]
MKSLRSSLIVAEQATFFSGAAITLKNSRTAVRQSNINFANSDTNQVLKPAHGQALDLALCGAARHT